MIAWVLAWIREWSPRPATPPPTPLPRPEATEILDETELVIRSQAADYAFCFSIASGLNTGDRQTDDHQAWELGQRLRRLHLEHERKRGGVDA